MKIIRFSIACLILLAIFAFGKKSEILKKSPKEIKNNFVPTGISGGMGELFVSKFEVSNANYKEFEAWILEKGDNEKASLIKVHGEGWVDFKPEFKPFEKFYYDHPAYQNYPVVNISYEAANAYCEFLSEKYSSQSEDYNYHFRLPSKEEWLKIANAGDAIYSWGTDHLRNRERFKRCNYFDGHENFVSRNNETGELTYVKTDDKEKNKFVYDGYEATAPVESYQPTQKGVYNLNGNVAEMVSTSGIAMGGSFYDPGYDVRNQSEKVFDKFSSQVGFRPVFEISLK